MNDYIIKETFDDYCILTLNQPNKRNALNKLMINDLIRFFEQEAEQFPIVILSGIGKGFCSGMDLSENPTPTDVQNFWKLLNSIYKANCICIAAVNGAARGGGVMLINICDIAISSDLANYGMPNVILKSSFQSFNEQDQQALQQKASSWLPLMGKSISPAEAKKFGIINTTVPATNLITEAKRISKLLNISDLLKTKKNLNQTNFDNSLRKKELFWTLKHLS